MTTLHVRKGDTVRVLAGRDAGVTAKVIRSIPKEERVVVEGVNLVKRHTPVRQGVRGAQTGGIVTQEAPIHVSNVQLVCPGCGEASRVGHRQDEYTDERTGKSKTRPVRVCRKCGADVE
ncbi:MAG: ribosomal protein [Frankiales bacterium]|nr:ribosomal protein [Frankiales bacterium]